MIIRTISNLPDYFGTSEKGNRIDNSSYMEMSKPIYNQDNTIGYSSRRVNYSTFIKSTSENIDDDIKSKYKLYDGCGDRIKKTDDDLHSDDCTLNGEKKFNDFCYVNKTPEQLTQNTSENAIATTGFVKYSSVNNNYSVRNNSDTPNGYLNMEHTMNQWVTGTTNAALAWRWEKEDMYIEKPESEYVSTICTIRDSGLLVVWGYISSPKSIDPTNAWVAMESKIFKGSDRDNGKWAMIQLQPWIVGNYSNQVQYVGFSVPINGKNDGYGLQIRFKCGFKPNMGVSGFGNKGLIFNINNTYANINTNSVNTMVGYILK